MRAPSASDIAGWRFAISRGRAAADAATERRITVTYNGEIYNEAELRSELERDFGRPSSLALRYRNPAAGYLAWARVVFPHVGIFASGCGMPRPDA